MFRILGKRTEQENHRTIPFDENSFGPRDEIYILCYEYALIIFISAVIFKKHNIAFKCHRKAQQN